MWELSTILIMFLIGLVAGLLVGSLIKFWRYRGWLMEYTKNDPHLVQASSVKSAGSNYVDVTVYGETFKRCEIQWNDPFLNKAKSDVLVQNEKGDWLRVWFYDKDILPVEP